MQTIVENSAIGTVMPWLGAVDQDFNEVLTYDAKLPTNALNALSINASSGRFVVIGLIDYENINQYIVPVGAVVFCRESVGGLVLIFRVLCC